MLTTVHQGKCTPGAVDVVVSGNREAAEIAAYEPRYFAVDGRPSDLGKSQSPDLIPLISDNWGNHFQWQGTGPLSAADRAELRRLVDAVHEEGKRLRFWATADKPTVWQELHAADVDLIGTDDLPALAKFLREQVGPEASD